MAQPQWCVHIETQNTSDDVTSAPLPTLRGIIDVIYRGALPARQARGHLSYYARDQSSDLAGFFRLDSNNSSSPVVKSACIGIPLPGQWRETAPIDFITDAGEVTGVKSQDVVPVRVRARWDKYDTFLVPQVKGLRVEIVMRRDNTPNPPDYVVLASHEFSLTTSFALYTTDLTLDTSWAANHRYLLRCVGRFRRGQST